MQLTRNLKWIVGASMVFVLLASATVAYGGGRWRGIDPELAVNGHRINVWVGWPATFNCSVDAVGVRFLVPYGADAAIVGESDDSLSCGDGTYKRRVTRSSVLEKLNRNQVAVRASVRASERFPVRVVVFKDGELAARCGGLSNERITCGRVTLDNVAGETASDGSTSRADSRSHELFSVH